MSDRAAVLERVRRGARRGEPHPGSYPPPDLPGGWARFAAMLESVGGRAHGPVAREHLTQRLAALAQERASGGRIAAPAEVLDRLGTGPWEAIPSDAEPHSLEDVAVAVLWGSVGVAESAAVAVEGRLAPVRALPFLCRHLVLVLQEDAIEADLHRAFARIPSGADGVDYLTWISGPSKTADIEQTLVYGAHGPITLDLVGIGRSISTRDT